MCSTRSLEGTAVSLPKLQKRDVNPGIQTVIGNSNHGTLNYLGLKAPECGSSSGRGPCILLLLQGQLREWVNAGRPLPGSGKLFWGRKKNGCRTWWGQGRRARSRLFFGWFLRALSSFRLYLWSTGLLGSELQAIMFQKCDLS